MGLDWGMSSKQKVCYVSRVKWVISCEGLQSEHACSMVPGQVYSLCVKVSIDTTGILTLLTHLLMNFCSLIEKCC